MNKFYVFLFFCLCFSLLTIGYSRAWTNSYGGYTSNYTESAEFMNPVVNTDSLDESWREEYKEKVETFCAPGVNNPERCNKYCKELVEEGLAHKYCGHSVTLSADSDDYDYWQNEYILKVETFCASGVNQPDKCSTYCGELTDSGGTHKYCGHTVTRGSGQDDYDQNLYRVKVEVFCSPGVNQSDKCSGYCNKLADENGVHQYCGTAGSEGGSADKKQVPASDDGGSFAIGNDSAEIVKNVDGTKSMIVTTNTDEKKEVIEIFFDENDKKKREEIRITEGLGSSDEKTEIKTIHLDEDENILEEIIENELPEKKKELLGHNIYNKKLSEQEFPFSNNNSIQFLVKEGQIEDSRIIYNKINDEILIYSKNVLGDDFSFSDNSEFKFKIKVSGDKLLISDSKSDFILGNSVALGNESGKFYIKTGEEKSELIFGPSFISEDIVSRLSEHGTAEIINEDSLKIQVQGKVNERFLWFFDVELESEVYYSFLDGSFIEQKNQGIWDKIKSKTGL